PVRCMGAGGGLFATQAMLRYTSISPRLAVIRGRAPCTPGGIRPAPAQATSDEIFRMCAIILTLRRDALKYVTAASGKYHECARRSADRRPQAAAVGASRPQCMVAL